MEEEAKKKKTKTAQSKSSKIKAKTSAGPEISYYEAVGRRKESTARVRLYVIAKESLALKDITLTRGAFLVNNRKVEEYFPGEIFKHQYLEPLRTTNSINRFGICVHVYGGGLSGQLQAVIHGLSRAFLKVDKDRYRPILKKRGFLTRDSRIKERRKAGYAGKARAKKQSPKR